MYVDLIQRKVICPFIDNPGLQLVQCKKKAYQ